MWKNLVDSDSHRGQYNTRMGLTCWIPKATNTISEYVTLLCHGNNGSAKAPHCCIYTYIACLV